MEKSIDHIPCSFCAERTLIELIDFGDVALAGGFLKQEDFAAEKKYPLRVCFCKNCYAVQVSEKIDPAVLFKNYFYFSSAIGTLRNHFAEYAKEVVERFLPQPSEATVLEFGSNDGVLLAPLAQAKVGTVVGIDPATNVVETAKFPGINIVNDYFNESLVPTLLTTFGKADMILANNVFAHISDINSTTAAIAQILKDDGVFIFEVHYVGNIIDGLQYDFIYHEHLYYYSLLALQNHLERHGMVIFDVKAIPIHGGSYRYYAAKNGSVYTRQVSEAVAALRKDELARGYDKPDAYMRFAAAVAQRRDELMVLIEKFRTEGKTIVGYGASGRANTMIQYCGIDNRHLLYMIDDAPAKHGFYTPGSHLLIRGNDALHEQPDYVLIFAWAFYEEIAKKCAEYLSQGGTFVLPLPNVRVLDTKS